MLLYSERAFVQSKAQCEITVIQEEHLPGRLDSFVPLLPFVLVTLVPLLLLIAWNGFKLPVKLLAKLPAKIEAPVGRIEPSRTHASTA